MSKWTSLSVGTSSQSKQNLSWTLRQGRVEILWVEVGEYYRYGKQGMHRGNWELQVWGLKWPDKAEGSISEVAKPRG